MLAFERTLNSISYRIVSYGTTGSREPTEEVLLKELGEPDCQNQGVQIGIYTNFMTQVAYSESQGGVTNVACKQSTVLIKKSFRECTL